jgi:hypothetical protein
MINRKANNYKPGDLISYLYSGYVPKKYGIIVSKKSSVTRVLHPGKEATIFTVMSSYGIEDISTDVWYIVKLN